MTAAAGEIRRQVPFRVRLFAWWQGYDPNDIYAGDPAEIEFESGDKTAKSKPARKPFAAKVPVWTEERVRVAERLWGEGVNTPGGEDHVMTLVQPIGLNPTMTVLDFGAGLGGSSRAMAKNFGCWVTGLEQWPVLVERGMEHARAAGLEKKAAIERFDPAKLELKSQGYNCIFAKEAFFTMPDKAGLFDKLVQALRPGGQVCFTDYVLPETGKVTPKVEEWIAGEPLEPHPWTSDMVLNILTQTGLDVRIAEDITDLHQSLILQGWRELTQSLAPGTVAPETVPHLVKEAELWAKRGAVLRTGDIRVYRFHAVKSTHAVM
jgi:SAM-dependent methyltransferase